MDSTPPKISPALQLLQSLIEDRPECLVSGSADVREISLTATKFLFELAVESENQSKDHIADLLTSLELISPPQTRSQSTQNGKRKRTPGLPPATAALQSTPIASLCVDGMNEDQVWAQLDLRTEHVCNTLDRILEGEPDWGDEDASGGESDVIVGGAESERIVKAFKAAVDEGEIDFDAMNGLDLDAFADEDDSLDENDSLDNDGRDSAESEGSGSEGFKDDVANLHDSSSDESEDGSLIPSHNIGEVAKVLRRKHSELDDGFFDLVSFNKETRQAEARSSSVGRLGDEDGSDDEEEMTLDLFAPLDVELEGHNFKETGAMYRDFFEPPQTNSKRPKSKNTGERPKSLGQVRFNNEVRVKKIRAEGKNLPLYTPEADGEGDHGDDTQDLAHDELAPSSSSEDTSSVVSWQNPDQDGDEDEIPDEILERLHRDLFVDEQSDFRPDLSTHEKRVSELREQIAELESENVGLKDWVMMGETTSRARPQNSLLEEDLEFERAMKFTPSITEEKVQGLEELVKQRILEGRFDDVIRRRKVDDRPFLPSRLLELKDTKSAQSLAQIYEDEYMSSQTGGVAGEDRDAKLKKEHDDVEHIWEKLCYKLDALCNTHFIPKPPKTTISSLTNVSAANLESALPSTKSPASMLAPEEVFSPSTSEPRSRSELTPGEKRALRNKERKIRKKTRDTLERSLGNRTRARGIGGVKKEQKAALETVVKSGKGVTIVGKGRKESRAIKKITR